MALLINELRIGNLVLSGKDEIVVYNIHEDCINYAHAQGADEGYSIESLTGIPLTEGRLRKFDLSNFLFTVFGDNNRGFHIAIDGDHWIFIKYVHTFQNLYFALCNEELVKK